MAGSGDHRCDRGISQIVGVVLCRIGLLLDWRPDWGSALPLLRSQLPRRISVAVVAAPTLAVAARTLAAVVHRISAAAVAACTLAAVGRRSAVGGAAAGVLEVACPRL